MNNVVGFHGFELEEWQCFCVNGDLLSIILSHADSRVLYREFGAFQYDEALDCLSAISF